jgi:hypothetical protein
MKHILTISFLFWSFGMAQAQVVPNGGFEEWDSTFTIAPYPRPLMWLDISAVNPNCPVSTNEIMQPSPLSSSGCCSVKLTTHPCKIGFIYSGDVFENMPRGWSFQCMARPVHLNFQYMFQPEGSDSAYVKILLFNYDSITPGLTFFQRVDTVAFASGYMHEAIASFTPYSLPIHYFTSDIPAFMHIWFSTSRASGFGPPNSSTSVGTTVWIDDVHLSGTTDINELVQYEPLTVFPNPAGDRIWFKALDPTGDLYVQVFDAKGAQVMDRRITDPDGGMDVRALQPGVYSIVLRTRGGKVLRTSWVKE